MLALTASTNLEAPDANDVHSAGQSPVHQCRKPAPLPDDLPPHARRQGVPQELREYAHLYRVPG